MKGRKVRKIAEIVDPEVQRLLEEFCAQEHRSVSNAVEYLVKKALAKWRKEPYHMESLPFDRE